MGPEFTGRFWLSFRVAPLAQRMSSQTPVDCRHLTLGGWSSPQGQKGPSGLGFPSRPNWNSAPAGGTFPAPKQDPGHLLTWFQGWSFRKRHRTNMESTQLLEKDVARGLTEGRVPEKQAESSSTLLKLPRDHRPQA